MYVYENKYMHMASTNQFSKGGVSKLQVFLKLYHLFI